ncbi:LysR family transcriptional regulator [Pseudoalteromonas ulvae]|uniref:Transcriptional regulator n=1 Tax=Pseudoalteromonas ulvae TaxID=107327 RepID=A0A244CLK2_PSEDV|nr:LysR family transcriptional regulator [Pseudoalteromonas ulvae]OUL56490.1 transcriptional regulator [Pseudoalteromonas ulvae]
MNKLRHMSLFMSIVEAGSITAAADKLNLSKSVLSQHLKKLEAELAITLLKRTTRRQSLTPAGERFYQHCHQMHNVAEQAWNEVFELQHEPMGLITITAPHGLMNSIVVPAITNAFKPYTQVKFNLICDDAHLDLMQHNIDLAIRVGESPDSNYRQTAIGTLHDCLCQKRAIEIDLHKVSYIANHWQANNISHNINGQTYQFDVKHRTNTLMQTVALIEAGCGIGLIPDTLAYHNSQMQVIARLAQSTIYALHPYSAAIPLAVSMARHAIELKLANKQRTE